MTTSPPQSRGGDHAVAGALQKVLADYGRRVAESPQRLRAMLSDALGAAAADHRAAIDALVVAAQEGVCADLMAGASPQSDGPQLVARLTEWGLEPATATWAVQVWAAALGGGPALQPDAVTAVRVPLPPVPSTAAAADVTAPVPTTTPPGRLPAPPAEPRPRNGRRRQPLAVAGIAAAVLMLTGGVYAFSSREPGGGSPGGSKSPEGSPSPTTSPTPSPTPTMAAPSAASFTVRYTPKYGVKEGCTANTFCAATVEPRVTGAWDKLVVGAATPDRAQARAETDAKTGDQRIYWAPRHNGPVVFTIPYYVVSKGVRSATAVVTVNMSCNRAATKCYGT